MIETQAPVSSAKSTAQAQPPDASKGMTLFVMIVMTLYFGKEVLVPVTVALLLTFILAPLVDLLRRIYLGRVPSVLLGVLLALSVITAIGSVIGSQIGELSEDVPDYVTALDSKVATVKHYTIGELSKLAKSVGKHRDGTPALSLGMPTNQTLTTQSKAPMTAPAAALPSGPLDFVQRYASPILTPLGNLGIVFIVTVFALLQREDLRDRLIRLIGSSDLHRTTLAIDEAGRRLSRYFVTQLSVNTVFGVVIGMGLMFIGVPNPVLWGILAGLLRFVPYVGSFIAAILPVALAAAVDPGWTTAILTASLYITVEALTGQVVEPLIYGHSTGLSPFSVIVAAIFWSWLWGPIGLILSTPLTLCLVTLGRHIKRLEFIDIMLGDRSPLTPVESFYQRILAGDADEVLDLAEKLLKDRSLSTYYDEVAIKGLQLAAHDVAREALDGEQLVRVRHTVNLLIGGLERYVDKQPAHLKTDEGPAHSKESDQVPRNPDPHSVNLPHDQIVPPWESPSAVLCIAGRGPLDSSASAMLSQLLGKHGLGSRLVDYNEVSRESINALDIKGVAMACVSFLDITGNPAHLRFLIQRLRQRLPQGTLILVGIWPVNDRTLNDATTKEIIGANYLTTSLEQAVTTCAEEAQKASKAGLG
ncbi:MAG: AI-2E family transporter [Alphaproteobacteria bacterium]